jgi:hypothetical protein
MASPNQFTINHQISNHHSAITRNSRPPFTHRASALIQPQTTTIPAPYLPLPVATTLALQPYLPARKSNQERKEERDRVRRRKKKKTNEGKKNPL